MLSPLNRPRPHWLGLIVTVVILVSVAYGGNDDDDESPTTLPTSTAGPPTATVAPPAAAAAPQATATLSQPAAATSAATSPAASGGGDYCVDLGSGPFDDDINVPADATCTLDGVTINANVKLARNATLHAHGATIDGDVQAEESAAVNVLDGTTVGGNIQVEHSGSVQVVGARVDGDIQLEHNDGAHVVNDNTVDGNIQLEHNTGGVEARNNTVDGNLQCEENAPAPSGGGNTVRGTRKASARDCKEGEYRVYMMEQPWVDFDAIREKTDLVIVPTGAVEVYGTHLPVGTDTIVVTHVARQVGERLGAPVLPALPVGFSRSLGDFPGTLSISTPTLMAYLRETAESVAGWGFKRFLFINSHRGNIGPVGEVAMALQDEHGARCAQVFWWDYVAALVKDVVETGAHANGHASEIGTSIMLHIAPELVVRDRIRDQPPTSAVPYADIVQYKGMKARSDTGVIGNPAVATAEKGAEIVHRGVERIIAFVREEFGG